MTLPKGYLSLAVFLILVYAIGLSGGIFTDTGPWFQNLRKPSFTPPNWVIPIVWNILYLLIAVSGWLMYTQTDRSKKFFIIYGANLVLNFLWSLIFFGMRSPGGAFVELVALWITIVFLIALAWGRSRAAACLLIPYLVWVSFAGLLNFFIAFVA
ncbi:MAG: TspO/MBR family protein [Candidatus Bathyarchaeia archaeon]